MIDIGYIYGLICSIFGTYEDLKKREVNDFLWISMLIVGVFIHFSILDFLSILFIIFSLKYEKLFYIGIFLFLISFLYSGSIYSISFIIFFIISLMLYYFNFMGGGDCKFLMGISYLNGGLFTIIIFLNSVIFVIPYMIYLFVYNIIKKNNNIKLKNMLLLFIGTKKKFKDINKFEIVLGKENNISYLPKLNNDNNINNNSNLKEEYNDNEEVWVTSKLPFLLFITCAYILYYFYESIIIYELVKLIIS